MNFAWIKKVYVYAVSLISLVILIIAAGQLVNMALKATVFKDADKYGYYPYECSQVEPKAVPAADCTPEAQEKRRAADEQNRKSQQQRDAAQSLSMIIVATPVFWYHWRLARREVQ